MIRWLLACLCCLAGLALAQPTASDEAQARRFHALTQELRCVVCQNESLADSTAPLALDLKREIRARMEAGQSDEQIRAFLVERYGDFVNYRPPLKTATYLLWLGPLLFLGVGLWAVLRHGRRQAQAPDEAAAESDSQRSADANGAP